MVTNSSLTCSITSRFWYGQIKIWCKRKIILEMENVLLATDHNFGPSGCYIWYILDQWNISHKDHKTIIYTKCSNINCHLIDYEIHYPGISSYACILLFTSYCCLYHNAYILLPIHERPVPVFGEVRCRSTGNSDKTKLYLAPGSHLKVYTDSFEFSSAEAWNKLPASVRESVSLGAFKSGYLKWYSSQ